MDEHDNKPLGGLGLAIYEFQEAGRIAFRPAWEFIVARLQPILFWIFDRLEGR